MAYWRWSNVGRYLIVKNVTFRHASAAKNPRVVAFPAGFDSATFGIFGISVSFIRSPPLARSQPSWGRRALTCRMFAPYYVLYFWCNMWVCARNVSGSVSIHKSGRAWFIWSFLQPSPPVLYVKIAEEWVDAFRGDLNTVNPIHDLSPRRCRGG